MFEKTNLPKNPSKRYSLMLEMVNGYLDPTLPVISNLSNLSAILSYYLPKINWVGFYLFQNESLILGPFQGLPACTGIPLGKGVCGTAAAKKETVIVPDVSQFSGHIACDSLSKSEIVIPIVKNGALFGVLDIDSPVLSRFGENDRIFLEKAIALLIDIL